MKTSKKLKKLTALFLVLVLALCMTAPAAATEQETDPSSSPSTTTGGGYLGGTDPAGNNNNSSGSNNETQVTGGSTTWTGVDSSKGSTVTLSPASDDNASITIMETTENNQYAVYKLFDASVDSDTQSVVYTSTSEIPESLAGFFTKDESSGYITATENAETNGEMSNELSTALKAWADGETATVSGVSNGGTLQFTGLDFGYYVVTNFNTTTGTASSIIVTTTNPTAILYDKDYTGPAGVNGDPIKYLTNPEQDTYAELGDKVGFTIKFVAPNSADDEDGNPQAVMSYTVTDTPYNLYIDTSTIVVKVNGTQLTKDKKTTAPYHDGDLVDYTVKRNIVSGVVTIEIEWAYLLNELNNDAVEFKYAKDSIVEITYTATVIGTASTTLDQATNKAEISYNRREGTVEGGTTLEMSKLNIQKVDTYGNQLEGAKFKLQKAKVGDDGNPLKDENDNYIFPTESDNNLDLDNYIYLPLTEEKDENGNVTGYHIRNYADMQNNEEPVYEIEAGKVTIQGLDLDMVYRLVEITAPDGFNLLEDPVIIEAVDKDEDGNPVDKHFEDQTIINSTTTNVNLPQTGGIGTTIFYIVGGVLAVGALVLLITRKRVHLEHE